jgi:hypothetical protein
MTKDYTLAYDKEDGETFILSPTENELGGNPQIVQELNRLQNLAAAWEAYANLLGDELNDIIVLATVHGWKSQRIEKGRELREKIKSFQTQS